MKESSILVISVIIKLQRRVVFRNIFGLYMKVSSILVISVIIKLHTRVIFRITYQQSTVTEFWSVTTVTFRQSGNLTTALTSNLILMLLNLNKFLVRHSIWTGLRTIFETILIIKLGSFQVQDQSDSQSNPSPLYTLTILIFILVVSLVIYYRDTLILLNIEFEIWLRNTNLTGTPSQSI